MFNQLVLHTSPRKFDLGVDLLHQVRDIYEAGDYMVLVTTDRQSAFDRVLASVPFKGQVLNQTSVWWFSNTKHITENAIVSAPDPNVTIAKKCTVFPVEFVVRGFMTGSTSTSLWTVYNNGARNYCGNDLVEGMKKNEKLEANIITPTTKAADHDLPISGPESIEILRGRIASTTRMHNDDDVWGSDTEGEQPELHHEWRARQNQFHTLGYRDGVEAGKNSSAQEGFNAGYAESTAPGFNWGVARGVCSAFAALPDSVKATVIGDLPSRERLGELASSLHRFSSTDAQRSFYRALNQATPGVGTSEEVSRFVGINRVPEAHGVGVWESEGSGVAAGKSELEDLEKQVRREFEVASINIPGVLGEP